MEHKRHRFNLSKPTSVLRREIPLHALSGRLL
nr:MAG TPA: hypothetical protein [Caudoviricetes sp.]